MVDLIADSGPLLLLLRSSRGTALRRGCPSATLPLRRASDRANGAESVSLAQPLGALALPLTQSPACAKRRGAELEPAVPRLKEGSGSLKRASTTNLISKIGPYLAGLIEGDGTFAVHNTNSTIKKYSPKIIIVFKKADLPLAKFLRELTNCGRVFIKQDRGYVLWQIQDLVSVFTIITIINGFMRTPKIEAMHRTID
jgi:hypothetical protein